MSLTKEQDFIRLFVIEVLGGDIEEVHSPNLFAYELEKNWENEDDNGTKRTLNKSQKATINKFNSMSQQDYDELIEPIDFEDCLEDSED